jgi:hypothetical protein
MLHQFREELTKFGVAAIEIQRSHRKFPPLHVGGFDHADGPGFCRINDE